MKTSVKFSKILAFILSAILMLTLLTANVFADTTSGEAEGTDAPAESADITAEESGEAAPEESGDVTADEHEDHDHESEAVTTAPAATEDDHDHSVNWVDIIVTLSIIVLAAIVLIICYLAIPKFRAKVKKFFSDYKSELKKVTWSSKQDVKRNTITVIVVVIALAIVIALLDLLFSGSISALGKVF